MRNNFKLFIIVPIIIFVCSACSNDEAPISIEMEKAYNEAWNYFYPKIIITSLKNNTEVSEIAINKGNCSFTNFELTKNFQQKKLLPKKLAEYQDFEVRVDKNCRVKVVDIVVNKNKWSFTFE